MPGTDDWVVQNNNRENIIRAVGERIFTVAMGGSQVAPPLPKRGYVSKELGAFRNRLVGHVGRVEGISTEQFVEGYQGRKRRVYQRAVDSLELVPLSAKDALISAFIKDDKIKRSAIKPDPVPRIIQPRSSRFNVMIGLHLKPMEKAVFGGIAAVFKSTTVFKGLNADERGRVLERKWNRFKKPVAIMLDAIRFDQHCSSQLIDWEHGLEESMAADPQGLRILNNMRKTNKCYARAHDGGVKYSVKGKRMSGDMDTAFGNCTSMCAMTWSFMRSIEVDDYEFINDGDDGALIMEEENLCHALENYFDYYLKLGFQMKLEGIARKIEHIDFCQSRPVWAGDHYRMVRNPKVCMAKDSFCLRNYRTPEEYENFRSNVGHCGLALAGDMPIFCQLYRKFTTKEDNRDTIYETGMQYMAHGMCAKDAFVSDDTRVSFWEAFDISPDEQLAAEELILSTDFSINGMPVENDFLPSIYKFL
jgi:hypothetical protein